MANWSLPTTGSKYVDYTAELNARLNDLAYGLDPAYTTASNVLVNFTRFSSANSRWEKYNGTSWVAMASSYAIDITGKAAALSTARAITLTGDASGTANFDGSAGISITTTLGNSGVTAGSFGSGTAIPAITVDAKGRVTSVSTNTVTPAWTSITGKPSSISGYGIIDAITNAGNTPSIQAGTFALRPAAATIGRLYLAIDTMILYRDNGSTWDVASPAYTGDVTKAVGGTALTLAASGVTAGTYDKVTVDAKGRVTSGAAMSGSDVTTALGYTPYNSTNPSGYITAASLSSYFPNTGGTITGALTINNASPTIYMKDTDGRSSMLHCNGNTLYVLRGDGTNSSSWAQYNGYWPVQINLENNDAQFGGNFTAIGDVTAFSDERFKTNWRDFDEGFIEAMAQVKHGIYDRTDTGLTQVGVGAQSLQKVMPWAVLKAENGDLSVAYGNAALAVGVALSQAIVSLKTEIGELRGEIAALKG